MRNDLAYVIWLLYFFASNRIFLTYKTEHFNAHTVQGSCSISKEVAGIVIS